MTELKQTLLSDTIRLLKENFDKETSWTVKASYVKPLNTPPISKKTSPNPTIYPTSIPIKKFEEKKKIEVVPSQKKEQEQEQEQELKTSTLEKKQEQLLPLEDLSKRLLKSFPQFSIRKNILSDKIPYINALETDCIVFSFKEGKESDLFLNNLQKALANHHSSACFFDATSGIPPEELEMFFEQAQAKLVIASSAILKNKALLPFLKEIPATSEWFIGKSRLFILESFTSYFTNPLKKKALWQTLCAILKSRNTQASS